MNPSQINEILDQHHRLNEDILERASRARMKEQTKSEFRSTSREKKLGTTLKKAIGPQKSMASTMNNFKGKKSKK